MRQSVGVLLLSWFLIVGLAGCGTLDLSAQILTENAGTPHPAQPLGYLFDDSVELRGYSLPDLKIAANDEVLLRLFWQVVAPPPHDCALALGLRGADGTLVWTAGQPVVAWGSGRLTTEHRLLFPEQLSEGDYGLEVWLSDPASGKRAAITGWGGGESVRLAVLHLTHRNLPSPSSILVTPVATAVYTRTPEQ